MVRNCIRWLLPATCAMAALAVHAQPQGAARAPVEMSAADPLDATVGVPPLVHRSALNGYRRLGDDSPVPWREANETVGRIGGWRAYAREASVPEPAASAAPAPRKVPDAAERPKPMQSPHGSHHMK